MIAAEQIKQKIEANVEKCPMSGCWLWFGTADPRGYGRMWTGGPLTRRAHRASYEAHVGPIPSGACVCHRCDTPACVNPAHLFMGTQVENVADMTSKRRQQRGAQRPLARLTESAVRDIRRRLAAGERIHQAVEAQRLGVARVQVWRVIHGLSWTHVTIDEAA
jgi:hypothetical protein